ncbi:hypothetical protein Gbem_2243 [Citrifermentans bemidjiense Bem]|uniref:Uncharacterized protein n=1 Tax=Citrifermentans bemidjiense (strain ATCC BAA-1014 / DSM 16622 / JCM 12645 / Bem) TaxID=404380 RepID=B5EEB0_CITBB|nr:hypothetical protein Gbem_2243 [Citrifermentans bemidjiense Bem]
MLGYVVAALINRHICWHRPKFKIKNGYKNG